MLDVVSAPFDQAAGWLQEHFVTPLLYALGLMDWAEVGYGWALVATYGVAQVAVTLAVCMPLERWRPAEVHRGGTMGVDVLYTLLARVGLLPLFTFIVFSPAQVALTGWLTDRGWVAPTLEGLFPALLDVPLLTFAIYAVVLDFAEYARHRLSHAVPFLYAVHAVHHAQREMTFWSDDRNHLLDDAIGFLWFTAVALAIGIPPLQFPLLVLALRFVEALSHANVRLRFGAVGERVLVSPRFHRAHHGLAAAGRGSVNYGAILPWWDVLFGTADFSRTHVRTGDAAAPETMATGGWITQQAAGVRELVRVARR